MAKKKPYDILKQHCTAACHERHACKEGYRQMLASQDVSQMMATWRSNWDDVTHDKFADIICRELPDVYPIISEEMNHAGIYWNECPPNARDYVRVLVFGTTTPVHIYGHARAYILGEATVIAHNHSQVHSTHAPHATIHLMDHTYGSVRNTDNITRTPFAKLNTHD